MAYKETPTMHNHLLKEKFPLDCENLPIEELTPEEQELAIKCIEKKDFTDEEYVKLKELIVRYDQAITEYNPKKVINNFKDAVRRINTAQDFIDAIDTTEDILVRVPVKGQTYEMEFQIQPINDSRALQGLALELNLFKNYTEEDKKIFTKSQMGESLTPEEGKVVNKINKELEKTLEANQDEIMIKFLARQLKLNDTDTHEKMIEFWSKFPINARVSVFLQVEEMLGLTESADFELFPVSK